MRFSSKNGRSQKFDMIIFHPMETGYRKDRKTGRNIPANYITKLYISVDGEKIISYALSENLSKNPYFSFILTSPVVTGQKIQLHWLDNNKNETNIVKVAKFDETGTYQNFKVNKKTVKK